MTPVKKRSKLEIPSSPIKFDDEDKSNKNSVHESHLELLFDDSGFKLTQGKNFNATY